MSNRLTVSKLVHLVQDVVESNFVAVTVEGEVSNFASPASGHWYFTLKDDKAQLRAVMFRGQNRLVAAPPRNGMLVLCSGSVSVYVARGEMQLVVDSLVPAGEGDLQAAFEALKARLAEEGLFAAERKRALPEYPRCVGVVTSATGAAIQDILNVLKRRAPGIRVLLRPVRVQGEGAAEEIATALTEFNQHGQADVLIVGRGGGSLEDLWAFNEEVVARAIAASDIPVISAVGHEIDFTIADFVADLRAPTPSAAAEIVAKSRIELETHLDHLIMRLQAQLRQSLALVNEKLANLDGRLRRAVKDLAYRDRDVQELQRRLLVAMRDVSRQSGERLSLSAGRLDALSPLKQLSRGYVYASHEKDGRGIVSLKEIAVGGQLWLRFRDGRARTRVEETDE